MDKKQKGQGLVEWMLVLPTIMVLVMGVANLFILFAVQAITHNSVAEGARVAQVWRQYDTPSCHEAVTAAVLRTNMFFDPARDVLEVSANCSTNNWERIPPADLITVRVIVNWEPFFFSTFWSPPKIIPIPAKLSVGHQ